MKNILFVILAACVMIIFSGSQGYAFRCGNEVITRGDSGASVLNKCGEPSLRESVSEMYNGQPIYVEKWSYNCGEQDFLYKLTILNSIIIKDDPFSRGFGKSQCSGSR